jgi:peptidoglycan pentaglycine glycine transferase (the first glycine)
VLDLSKSSKELFSEMKPKHRQYIRKSQRDGVRIRLGKEQDLGEFCNVIASIAAIKGHVMHECGYYKRVWEQFSKQEKCVLLIAIKDEKILGSYMIVLSDENAYEMYGGCNEEGNVLRANYLMKWEAINYCKTIGKNFYDQWGAEEWYPGLVQFKEGFGGNVVEYPPQFVYVYDKVAYSMYKFLEGANRLKQKLL